MHALLNQLSIENFRNITAMSLSLDEGLTAFTGDNGAGKTSVLDAVHLLGTGKPFSTHRINHVSQREASFVQVVGRLQRLQKQFWVCAGIVEVVVRREFQAHR